MKKHLNTEDFYEACHSSQTEEFCNEIKQILSVLNDTLIPLDATSLYPTAMKYAESFPDLTSA